MHFYFLKAKNVYFCFYSNIYNSKILAVLEIIEVWEKFRSEQHKLLGGIIETEGFETHREGLCSIIQEQLNNVKMVSKTPMFQEAKTLGQEVNKVKSTHRGSSVLGVSKIAPIIEKANNMPLDEHSIRELSGKISRNVIHRCVFSK